MSDGALTFTPDPLPRPGAGPPPGALTFTPDPPAVPATSTTAPLTFTPDPTPEPATPPALTPLSSLYSPTTGAPGAESLGDISGPPMPPAPTPAPPTAATAEPPQFTDPMSGLPMAPLVNGPPAAIPDTGEGLISGLGAGFRNTMRNYARTFSGDAFTPDPYAIPQPQHRTWLNELGYGLGGSPVVLGGGIAGGVAGGAAGAPLGPGGAILGSIIGSGFGMGLPATIEALGPAYQAAMQRPDMTHEAAVDYAINHAINTGSITAATAPLFVLSPFKNLVGRLLYQSLVGMPAAGAITRAGVPGVMGEPLPSGEELARGATQDVAMGLGFGLGHHVGSRIIHGAPEAPPVPQTSPIDMAAVEALRPTGQVYRTERPSDVFPVPEPPALEQPVVTAAAPSPAEPYAQTIAPAQSSRIEPAPAAEAPPPPVSPATRALSPEPLVSPAGPEAPTARPAAPEPAPSTRSEPAVEPTAPIPPSRPPEPVIGEPVDRPGAAAGRPGTEGAVGEAGPAPVVPGPGEIPGAPRLGAGGGERPGDTQAARAGEQPAAQPALPAGEARPAVGAEPAARETPTPAAEQAAPVTRTLTREEIRTSEVSTPKNVADAKYILPDGRLLGEGDETHEYIAHAFGYGTGGEDSVAKMLQDTGAIRINSANALFDKAGASVDIHHPPTPRQMAQLDSYLKQRGGADVSYREQFGRAERGVDIRRMVDAHTAETTPAPTTRDTPTPAAEQAAPVTYGPTNVHPESIAGRIDRLEQLGQARTPEQNAELQSLHTQRSEAEGTAYREWNDLETRRKELATQIDTQEKLVQRLQNRNPYAVDPSKPLVRAREQLGAMYEQRREIEATRGEVGERNRAERDRTVYGPPEDQAVVPGTREEPGTTGPADPTLTKLQATRDALTNKVRTPAEERKLNTINQQIARREAALEKARATEPLADQAPVEDRRGGVKQPFSGPPRVGREPDFLDYKFNNGTSVYRSILAEAGHNPDTATSLPIEKQIPILTSHMVKKFGFKSVEVVGARGEAPSRVDMKIARDAMLDTTRAAHDVMAVLGLPAEALSDHGNLRLVLAPAEPGRYGSYSHDGTLTIRGGANSLGHEWIHAIDHLLAERFTNNPRDMNKLLTQYGRNSGLDVTDNVQAAMAKLINTMFYEDAALAARHLALTVDAHKVDKAGNPTKNALVAQDQLALLEAGGSKLRIHSSEFRRQSAAIDPKKAGYYASVYEMLARAGEAYMADKARASGVDPRGFVMPDEAYSNMVDRQLRMAYPKEERAAIFLAYDDLFKAMQAEGILDKGKPPLTSSNYSISDPHYWSITAPAAASAGMTGLPGLVKREINSYRNFTTRLLDELKLTDPNRPPPLPGQRWADRTKDYGRATLYSYGSIMKVIIARAPPEAQKILQPILDSLATAPGSGRYTPENFEEKVRFTGRGWTRQFGNMLEDAGFKLALSSIVQSRIGRNEPMTTEQGLMLRHGLVTAETRMPDGTPIPANIQELTGNVRQLLDRVWDHARDAGLDIGYAKNGFYPRIYDRYRAASDAAGFRRAAHKLYSLMFDQELGSPGSDPQALLEKWTTMPSESRAIKTNALAADPNLPATMNELRNNLARQREIEANPNPTPAEIGELGQLRIDAERLAIDAHDSLRGHIAEINAASWHANLTGGAMSDFDTGAPGGRFLQARVLPPEADQIMAPYMHTDPMVAIPAYLHSVARRAAHAELFGANGEALKEAENKLNHIDGMSGDDVAKFMELVADVTGRQQMGAWVRFGQSAHNIVQGMGTLAMMERAVWSSLTEPTMAGLATGNMKLAFKNLGYTFGHLMRTADARDRTALAEFLNVISSPQHDSVMLSRQGVDVNDQPRMGRLLSNFYRATFLTQITNAQRAATVAGSNWFVDKLAQHIVDTGADKNAVHGREDAARWLNELGLPQEYHKDFSQFMVDLQGKLPTPDMLKNHRFGDAYSLVIRRLTDRIIQDPYKVDRAMLSGRPILGLAYQLLSFNSSLQKNVLNPAGERLIHNFSRGRGEAMAAGAGQIKGAVAGLAAHPGALASTVGAAFAVFATSLLTTTVRQYIMAPDQWDEHSKEGDLGTYLKDLAFSRSGLNGVLDPILQVFSHLKYDSDLTALMHGASINTYIGNLQKVLQPILGQTDANTNTALYNQARGLYNLVGVPLAAYGLSAVSAAAGPIGRIGAGILLQTVTSPGASNRVATFLAGRKGTPRPETGAGGAGLGELPGMGGMAGLPGMDAGGAAPSKGGGGGSGLGAAAGPVLGLIDDVAIPSMRYLGPMISSLSPGTKAAVGIAAGAYGAYEYLKQTAPFRGQPAPKGVAR